MDASNFQNRASLYTASRGRTTAPVMLGDGTDGCVWKTLQKTAIKVFAREFNFKNELACYQILHESNVQEIFGYAVPQLIDYDRDLLVIEMTIVEPPYILDFGKVSFKREMPQFSPEVIEESRQLHAELFGDHWPEVRKILARLESYGIYHSDPKPANIRPANWNPPLD